MGRGRKTQDCGQWAAARLPGWNVTCGHNPWGRVHAWLGTQLLTGPATQAGGDRAGGGQAGWGAEKTTGEAFFRKWSAVPRSSEASRECTVSRRGPGGGGCAQRIPSRSGSAATVTAANCLSGLSTETLTGATSARPAGSDSTAPAHEPGRGSGSGPRAVPSSRIRHQAAKAALGGLWCRR